MSEWSFTCTANFCTKVAQALLLMTSKPSNNTTQALVLAEGRHISYPYVEIRGSVMCDVLPDID
jgi:hypothetical protein